RTEGLVVKSVGDEMLVYDLARHRALGLNTTAAAVWRACDGTRTPAEIGVRAGAGQALDPAVVHYALSRLDRAHLLAGAAPAGAGAARGAPGPPPPPPDRPPPGGGGGAPPPRGAHPPPPPSRRGVCQTTAASSPPGPPPTPPDAPPAATAGTNAVTLASTRLG